MPPGATRLEHLVAIAAREVITSCAEGVSAKGEAWSAVSPAGEGFVAGADPQCRIGRTRWGGQDGPLRAVDCGRVPGRQMRGDPRSSQSLNAASVSSGGLAVNLLDTPGNADFVGEVRAGLRAADAVLFVVLPATDLIDDATRLLWRECEAIGMARAVAVTKLEHARADFDETVDRCRLDVRRRPATLPVVSDGVVTGEINLLRRTVLDYSSGEPTREATPEEAALLEERRNLLMESIIEESEDEDLLERHLSGEEVELSAVADDLRAAIATAFLPDHRHSCTHRRGHRRAVRPDRTGLPSPVASPMPAVFTASGKPFGDLSCDPSGPMVAEVVHHE